MMWGMGISTPDIQGPGTSKYVTPYVTPGFRRVRGKKEAGRWRAGGSLLSWLCRS